MGSVSSKRPARTGTANILLVGDGLSSVTPVLSAELSEADVTIVSDSDAALDRLGAEPEVDCVVAEHDDGSFDGVAFLRAVRDRYPALPFVLYVSDAAAGVVISGLDAGVTDIVDSTDDAAEELLVHRVENALATSGFQRGVGGERPRRSDPVGDRETDNDPRTRRGKLHTLKDSIRELVDAESVEDASRSAELTLKKLFPSSAATVYVMDEARNGLIPASSDGSPIGPHDGSLVWDSFVASEGVEAIESDADVLSTPQAMTAPFDGFGVLTVEWGEPGRIDDESEHLVELVADLLEQSFSRIHCERTAREQAGEFHQRIEALERRHLATETLLDVERAVSRSVTREELETDICETLAELDWVNFAWVGDHDTAENRLVPRAHAGAIRGYFDDIDFSVTPENSEPAVRAARDVDAVLVENVSFGLREEPWRRNLLNRGNQSVLSLPLVSGELRYGVLTVGASDAKAFGDLWRSAFEEIADAVAFGIDAISDRQALKKDHVVGLDVRIRDSSDILRRLADQVDGTVSFEGRVSQVDATSTLYLSVDGGSADEIREYLEESASVDRVERIASGPTSSVFAITTSEPTILSSVRGTGVSIRDLTATPTETHLSVELTRRENVRGFLERLREEYPTAELRGCSSLERPTEPRQMTTSRLTESLTDRQLEVLKTAYLNGYFEWPRERTGEEIAALLDITQPTFNNHLRVVERKLFSALFESELSDGDYL
ncbi:bacterio-opsin activator domain-containing protein [Halobellus captivus]|uniref:bacterio-opsin activator domain-containing protein n=1 Tax=Halobellus captivus TaxID=2592614 RepID=UPI0011A2165C|nr:bacterio-opsin activator domain-containing protein [Halobellus captivus]